MSEQDERGRSGRWVRREQRLEREKQRLKKHGASLRCVYIDAIRKRLKDKR